MKFETEIDFLKKKNQKLKKKLKKESNFIKTLYKKTQQFLLTVSSPYCLLYLRSEKRLCTIPKRTYIHGRI